MKKKHKKEEHKIEDIVWKPCPWCGSSATLSIEKMWEETSYGKTGYVDNYCYFLQCCNPECRAIAPHGKVVDLYISPQEAQLKAIRSWNYRGPDE